MNRDRKLASWFNITILTLCLTTAQPSNSETGNAIFPLDHLIKTPVTQLRIQASLNNGEQILPAGVPTCFVLFYAAVQPSH